MPMAANPNKVNTDPLNSTLSQRVRRNRPRASAIDQVANIAPSAPASNPAARMGAKLIENDERSYSSKANSSEITTRPMMAAATSSGGGPPTRASVDDTPSAGTTTSSSSTGKLSRARGDPRGAAATGLGGMGRDS